MGLLRACTKTKHLCFSCDNLGNLLDNLGIVFSCDNLGNLGNLDNLGIVQLR